MIRREGQFVRFEEYVAQRRRGLCRFAGVLSGDAGLADEIVADVLGVAYERWERIGQLDNPHAYVRRMIVNEYLGWRRRALRTAVRSDVGDLIAPAGDHAETHAVHSQLVDELRRLPAKQRAALVLRYYEGLPFDEIARLLGSGENAVRSNVSRALKKLRIELAPDAEPARFPATVQEVSR
jgi:RNA polymerase sigma-70 factor (sigma-E family)